MQKVKINPNIAPDTRALEEIKKLRTNLEYIASDDKVILFTSSVGGEGKTMISFYIAKVLAESGKKVVFVDANLRNQVSSILVTKSEASSMGEGDKNPKIKNLRSILLGECLVKEAVVSSGTDNLDVIYAGEESDHPSELLSSHNLSTMMEYLRSAYDTVIIDAPAVYEITDATIIAGHCDGAILVLEPGFASHVIVQKAKKELEISGIRILGVVLNKVI